jgi:hypothetical protein
MKNIGIPIIAFISLIAISCEKENLTKIDFNDSTLKSEHILKYELNNIPIVKVEQDINYLMKNPFDDDDEKISKYLYLLSIAIRDLIMEPEFNKIIINMALNSENQTANLLELKKHAPNYYSKLEKNLNSKGLSLVSISNDFTRKPTNPNLNYPETAKIEKYYPAIFIPNLENLDATLQPIISPNVEVDCSKDESIEDNIIAWFYTKEGNMEEIIISEETSLKTKNPLFLLDNASNKVKKNKIDIVSPKPDLTANLKSTSSRSYSSYEYSIEEGYEYESWTSGKSEFCIEALRIDPEGVVHWIYNSSWWKMIAEVSHDDIGDTLYTWSHHADNWTPYANNYIFWNTFERDWNRSSKSLGSATKNGVTVYVDGRMRYDDNWYAWIPETLELHYTRFDWINYDGFHWNNSWKSKFCIRLIE